ncbi:hypothetical protein [uncultured Helicobacter sp.]|uniref:hypothetical protein n=1 Tax=uncultured Helicobacter sp. TaxID=175537 RepID=UPI003750EBCF
MVYRKGASPSGVPDAITPRDSISLLKTPCMLAQRSEVGIYFPRAIASLLSKLAE